MIGFGRVNKIGGLVHVYRIMKIPHGGRHCAHRVVELSNHKSW
jgi:hypothetical protein